MARREWLATAERPTEVAAGFAHGCDEEMGSVAGMGLERPRLLPTSGGPHARWRGPVIPADAGCRGQWIGNRSESQLRERRNDFALREAHEDELDIEARARLRGGDAHEPAQVRLDAEPDQATAPQPALFPVGVTLGCLDLEPAQRA